MNIIRPTLAQILKAADPKTGCESLPWEEGSGGPPVDPNMYGLGGWSATSFYKTADGEGSSGGPALSVAAFIRQDALAAMFETISGTLLVGSNEGWILRRSSSGNYEFGFSAGGPFPLSPGKAESADDNGKWHLVVGTWDDSANIARLYWNDAEVGSGKSTTATMVPGTTEQTIGGRDGTTQIWNGLIAGVASGAVTLTGSQVANLWAACKAQRKMVGFPGADHLWDVKTSAQAVPSEWANLIGADGMDKQGTGLSLTIDETPEFGT